MKSYKFTNLIEVYDQVQSMIEGTRIFAMNEGVSVDITDVVACHSSNTAYVRFMVDGFEQYSIRGARISHKGEWEWDIALYECGKPVKITKEQLYNGSFVTMC